MAKSWDDFVKGLNSNEATFTNPVIAEAQAAVIKEANETMGKWAKTILTQATAQIQDYVKNLREYRRLEADLKVKLAKTNEALEYFGESGNPFPLYHSMMMFIEAEHFCRCLGITYPRQENDPLWTIPASWKKSKK